MLHPLTSEQSDIKTAFQDAPKESMFVEALAGCGKTTMIEILCKSVPRHTSTLVLAFNVKIKDELKLRLGKTHCEVMTMNSLGGLALRMGLGRSFIIDQNKP